jgi:curved DNA-binding protein CbpA
MSILYQILGVNSQATSKDIKLSFHKKILKCHPDKLHNVSSIRIVCATEEFKRLTIAYKILSDPLFRKSVDSGGLLLVLEEVKAVCLFRLAFFFFFFILFIRGARKLVSKNLRYFVSKIILPIILKFVNTYKIIQISIIFE